VVRFGASLSREQLIAQALALGHVFGNQHVPVEVVGNEAHIPLTTSESVARATVKALALKGATVLVQEVRLGSATPLRAGHSHPHD
jgi:urease accessory protein